MNVDSLFSRSLSFILALALVGQPLFAPPRPVAPAASWRIYAPFFEVGRGYTSTIFVRNRHVRFSATVTPIIVDLDGDEHRLPPVQIPANSVRAISVEEELEKAGQWVGVGALALEYQAANATVLNAQLLVKNVGLGIVFDLPLEPGPSQHPAPSVPLNAPWWFREPNLTSRVALFNASSAALTVHPSVLLGPSPHRLADVALAPHQVRHLDLRDLLQSAELTASAGMVSLTHDGPQGALQAALLSADERTGYSLTTQFTSSGRQHGHASSVMQFPGVMVNQQDPAMGFPRDLRFTPYAILGNTTAQAMPVKLQATFVTIDGTGLQHADLRLTPLQPFETRVVNFSTYLKSGLLPSTPMNFTLQVEHPGALGDLVFQVFSLDQTGNYVFSAEARASSTLRSDFVYWSTEGNNDTMVSIYNAGEKDVPAVVTIGFNDGKSAYRFAPITVQTGATVTLDLKQLLAGASEPDDRGHPIPQDADFGTLRVEPADGQPVERLRSTAAVYDPVAGTCGGTGVVCNIADSLNLAGNPLLGAVGTSQQVTATVQWDDGTSTDVTSQATFNTSASSVISVQSTPGSGGNGMASFASAGNATITGNFIFSGATPSDPPPECPVRCPEVVVSGPTSGTTVSVVLSIRTTGTTSSIDSAAGQYLSSIGTPNLGALFSTGTAAHLWRTGVEIVGTVSPSDFTGAITLQRQVDITCTYNVATLIKPCSGPFGDTSDQSLRDDNPGSSNSQVFDLDAPALGSGPSNPVNTLLRIRTNFRQWATLSNGTRVSADFQWFSRISIIKTSSGDTLANDISGDNAAGSGTTPVTWNLQ